MRSHQFLSILGAGALVAAVAQNAFALTGAVCNASKGTAVIANPGLNGSTPQSLSFAFSNDCGGGVTQGCAVGALNQATCAENLHAGSFTYCGTGSCSLACDDGAGGLTDCTPDNVGSAQVLTSDDCAAETGSFSGACVGNLCVGSVTAQVLYLLAFDQATSQAALATCPPTPVGTGGSLTSASFTGVIVY